jgi:NADH-quinone oxidoreductase subunit G
VGSLISKDFLHKARAWELDKTASICTGCSQGCNIGIEARQNTVVRLRPRTNDAVNRTFMCDHGRLHYRWMNRGDRIEAPLVRRGGALVATDWEEAVRRAAELIAGAGGDVVVLASAGASNEALFLARRLAGSRFRGAFRVARAEEEHPLPGVPNLALRKERVPNAKGAEILGYAERFDEQVRDLSRASVVLVLDENLEGIASGALVAAPHVIYAGTVLPGAAREAAVVLPITTVAEEDGTFVNRDGRVQRYFQAISGPGMARPAWWVLSEVLAELGQAEPLGGAADAFALLAADVEAFGGLTYESLALKGALLARGAPAGVAA